MPLPSRTSTTSKSESGFTLIELMITIAIIGIIAGIAIPSYSSYMVDARRLDGQVALRSAAQRLERCRTETFTFVGCTFSATSPDNLYTVTGSGTFTATAYTLTATPIAGKSQEHDTDCKTLTLSQSGQGATGDDTTRCW